MGLHKKKKTLYKKYTCRPLTLKGLQRANLLMVGNILPGVMEGTNRTTAAGKIRVTDRLMQWTSNPTCSLNEPCTESKKKEFLH